MELICEGYTDTFCLSTGRTFDANCHILGISPDGSLSGGYDSGIDARDFTREERLEVAAYAIAQWVQWASAAPVMACPMVGEAATTAPIRSDLEDFARLYVSPRSWVALPNKGWAAMVDKDHMPEDYALYKGASIHVGKDTYRCVDMCDFGPMIGVVVLGEVAEEGGA